MQKLKKSENFWKILIVYEKGRDIQPNSPTFLNLIASEESFNEVMFCTKMAKKWRVAIQILQKTPNKVTIKLGFLKIYAYLCIFMLDFDKCKRYTKFER